ncbi:hypothetical protein Tco_1123356 [Tanacetum coccineum]|uniref:Retrotransposon gag domain-containing protein n=1 Tax=Tanacetum coccineum TaxID=301880 RepID=A0ABQ5J344_9ASTR
MYQTFYPEQRTEFYSLNNVSVLPNNTTYFVNSIRPQLTEAWIDLDELCKKIFKDLQCHTFSGIEEDDVVNHIADYLEILDPIKMANFDTNQLRVNIFPLSLTRDAKVWWLNERDNKITDWGMLAERFFYKYFPLSHNGKNYIKNHCNRGGPSYCEFMAWIDSKHNDKRINRMTKSALGHAWVYRWGIDDSENDIASSDEEREESGGENPPNTIGDSLLEPYVDAHNENAKPRKYNFNTHESNKAPCSSNMNDTQPNRKRCKVEKFKVIKYSVGDNKEFLAVRARECNS